MSTDQKATAFDDEAGLAETMLARAMRDRDNPPSASDLVAEIGGGRDAETTARAAVHYAELLDVRG